MVFFGGKRAIWGKIWGFQGGKWGFRGEMGFWG